MPLNLLVMFIGKTENGANVFIERNRASNKYEVVKRKEGARTFRKPFFSEHAAHLYAVACVK